MRTGKDALSARLEDLTGRLEAALLNERDWRTLSALEREGDVLRGIQARSESHHAKWRIPLVFAAAALLVVGVGSLIRQTPAIGLDATVAEVHFRAASQDAPLATGEPLDLTDFRVVGDPEAASLRGKIRLHALTVLPGTAVSVRPATHDCYSIVTDKDSGGGIDILAQPTGEVGSDSSVEPHRIAPGAEIAFCGSSGAQVLLAGPVSSMDVWQVYRQGKLPIILSGIRKGLLKIANTGRKVELTNMDRVSLREIRNGWIVLYPGKELHIVFSGDCAQAFRLGLSPFDKENLAPTWVAVASQSPVITALFGAITGFAGVLWGLWRYFGLE